MPAKTRKTATKPDGWSAARQHLANWDKPALLALVKDLYDSSAVNRDFIHARCEGAGGGGAVLETYRRKIIGQFFSKSFIGNGPLKLGEARKAIRDYRKATGNLAGTVELLMTYVENGTEFTRQYGDINERFYNSLESALDELAGLLRGKARETYPEVSERLATLEMKAGGIGWGYGDRVFEVVEDLKDELSPPIIDLALQSLA